MSDGFDLGGGAGGISFSWGPVGTQPGGWVQGTVLDMKEVQSTNFTTKEPETWPNGDPKMQYRVTLATDLRDPANAEDDGARNVFLDGRRRPNDDGSKSKLCAVLDAVREATGGTHLQRGGKLTLQWVSGMGVTGDPRCFTAWYEAPVMALGSQPPGVQAPVAPPAAQTPAAAPPAPPNAPVPQPAPQAAAPPAPPVAQPAAVATEQGPVNPATGQISGPTPEAIAALQAAGVDPAAVYPGWTPAQQTQPVG